MSFWTTLFGKCRPILMIWIICKILLIHQVDPDNLQKQVKAWFELFPLSVQRSYIFFPFCSEPPLGLVSKLLWQVCYSLSSLSKQFYSYQNKVFQSRYQNKVFCIPFLCIISGSLSNSALIQSHCDTVSAAARVANKSQTSSLCEI